jgi:exodeoxyribonuclease VII small subunit
MGPVGDSMPTRDMDNPEAGMRFEDALRRANQIVDQLEGDTLELDQSLALFEEGVQLLRAAEERLNRAQERIQVLSEDGAHLSDLPGTL